MSPHRPRGPVCSVGCPGSSLGPGTISQKQRPDHLERGPRREEMRFSLRPCGSGALPHLDRLIERVFLLILCLLLGEKPQESLCHVWRG